MGAGGASAAMHAGNEGTAALVPQHKGLLASSGGGGQSALRRGMNQASADKGGGMPGDNLQNKMDAAIKRHRRDRGITSISEEQAFANDQRYRTKEMEHINRLRRDNGGNPLANEDEIRAQFKSDYQAATGHDTRHGNTWRHHGNVPEDARKSITNTIRNAIKNAGGPRDGGSPPVGGGSTGAASQETKSPV